MSVKNEDWVRLILIGSMCVATASWIARANREELRVEKLEMEAIRRGYAELVLVDHEIVFQWKESYADGH